MQNKKSLLQRLLVIYITFFTVLVVGMAHSIIPSFRQGMDAGAQLGVEMVENYSQEHPHLYYMLGNIPVTERNLPEVAAQPQDGDCSVRVLASNISLVVEQPAGEDTSLWQIAFSSVGGSPWLYVVTMVIPLLYLAVIVLMILIINSLRCSIREERTLQYRNVWRLRAIGGLAIAAELLQGLMNWHMAHRAAELLDGSRYVVDTSLQLSYSMIIMGILVIFAAEVFAIGQNLSEEQRLTI